VICYTICVILGVHKDLLFLPTLSNTTMARAAVDQTSLTHCKECATKLDKNKLKGNLCMKCHYQYMNRYRLEKRQKAIEHLGDKCADCDKQYPSACYDFHHTDPNKKDDCVSILIRNNRKLETILNEASKCELLCSNCHRIRHFK